MNGSHRLIVVGANRLDKFKRDFPKAVHFKAFLKAEAAKVEGALTDDDKFLMNFDKYQFQALTGIDGSEVKDPTLAEVVNLVNNKASNVRVDAWNSLYSVTRYLYGYSMTRPTSTKKASLAEYPLLKDMYGNRNCTPEHALIYINAVYAAKNGVN